MAKSNYKIGIGHNLNAGSVNLFLPQPRSLGVQYTRITYIGNGNPYVEGRYIELMWSMLDSEVIFNNILRQAGVYTSYWSDVTLYARDETWEYNTPGLMNGVAHRPFLGQDASWEYFPKDVRMLIKNLEYL